ncbi:MAG: hypothetical protein IJB49_06855 [Clostridia bacterium]|nr:hypothetical protein [Clostridia bacterium]
MKKICDKYFNTSASSVVFTVMYFLGCAIAAFGLFNIIVGNPYGGVMFLIIGAIPVFISSQFRVSDKRFDEMVGAKHEEYLENHIKGKTVGKTMLEPADFSLFEGFIRDDASVRFKSCRDGKIRTTKHFVTAFSINDDGCFVSTTVYDFLSDEEPKEQFFAVLKDEKFEFTKEAVDFPNGNLKCSLKTEGGELTFWLPGNDFLVEQLIEKITDSQKRSA